MSTLVVGGTDAERLVCSAPAAAGVCVIHVHSPTEDEVRARLLTGPNAVAVVVRGGVIALRYALLIEHVRPDVADIAVPSIVAACSGPGLSAIDLSSGPRRVAAFDGDTASITAWSPPRRSRGPSVGSAARRFRGHDTIAIVGRRAMPTRDQRDRDRTRPGRGAAVCPAATSGRPGRRRRTRPSRRHLRLAMGLGVPVVIAHAEDRATLKRVSADRTRGLAAMGSDELDNVEAAIAALVPRGEAIHAVDVAGCGQVLEGLDMEGMRHIEGMRPCGRRVARRAEPDRERIR